jgi:hypothetical protein
LSEKFFSQIAKNIKKKDFIFFRKSPPKASMRRCAGKIILPLATQTLSPPISRLREMLYPRR